MPIESRPVRAIEEVFKKVKKMLEDAVYRRSRNASSPSSIHGSGYGLCRPDLSIKSFSRVSVYSPRATAQPNNNSVK